MLTLIEKSQSGNLASDYSGSTSDERILQMWIHDKSKSTAKYYQRVASHLLEFAGKGIQALTLDDLYQWIDAIAVDLKPATVKTKIYAVKSLLTFANRIGYTTFNVGAVIKAPKVSSGIQRKCLKPAQIKDMAASVESDRDSLIIRLGYVAGLRASEISALTWDCLHNDTLTLTGKGGKQRSIKLPDPIANNLQDFRPNNATDDDPIFPSRKSTNGGHLDRRSITRIIKNAAVASGQSEKVSAHWLRHSHAYNALQSGVSVALIRDTLGHSSLATTSQYLAISPDDSSAMSLSI